MIYGEKYKSSANTAITAAWVNGNDTSYAKNLSAEEVDKLQTIPYEKFVKVANSSLNQVAKKFGNEM